jgi:hypothetical protein
LSGREEAAGQDLKHTAKISDCERATPRFVRRTALRADEYRKNFRQVDVDVIAAVTSREADRITTLMSKIYLRLVNAPAQYWEREGVLRFEAGLQDEAHVNAWGALCEVVGVASATASKALRWMHEQGIIGYFAGKNGVGIRVFLNRATSSIGSREAGKKILEFPPASSAEVRASSDEAAFSDSYADSESLETGLNPRAPKNGAEQIRVVKKYPNPCHAPIQPIGHAPVASGNHVPQTERHLEVPVEEIVSRLRDELEPALKSAARQAAAREHERTREWLESRGLPKVARVAQREAYNVLRQYGVFGGTERGTRSHTDVGHSDSAAAEPHPLSQEEVDDLAGACVALLETRGQSVELTLSEMSAEGGGFLLPEDAVRVRKRVNSLLATGCGSAGL